MARRLRAVELRAQGKAYRDIAAELGVDVHRAWDYVQDHYGEMKALGVAKLEKMRARDLAMLDRWLQALSDKCDAGDEEAIKTAEKLLARRAKLAGLDAPAKIDVKDERTQPYAELSPEERIQRHREAIAEEEAKMVEARH